jgi:uncharacterized protein
VAMVALRTIGAALALTALAVPAAAQMVSEGTEFLRAIEDRAEKANEIGEMLRVPGTTLVNARELGTGRTALHIVIGDRDMTWVGYLIQQRANVNLPDSGGVTPLMLAAQINFIEGVERLIAAGARVDVANASGETPLIFAVHGRNADLMRVLLQAGANPDRKDNSGRSARDYARLRGASDPANDIITRYERPASQRPGAATYGPTF